MSTYASHYHQAVDKSPQAHIMRSIQQRGRRVNRRPIPARSDVQAESGQIAVEWLMVAGILTAVAIILTGMFQPVLVSIVRMLARGIRTVGL